MRAKDIYFFISAILASICYFAFFESSVVDFNREALIRYAIELLLFLGGIIILQALLFARAFQKPPVQDFIYSFTFMFSIMFAVIYFNSASSLSYALQFPEELKESMGEIGVKSTDYLTDLDPYFSLLLIVFIPALLQVTLMILRRKRHNKKVLSS